MKYIDYFALPQFSNNSDALYRARLLVGITLSYTGIIICFLLFFVVFPGLSISERLAGIIPVGILGATYPYILYLIRTQGKYYLCSHLIIGSTFIGIAGGIYVSGGSVDTPSSAILMLPVILAFCLLGQKSGLIWAGTVFTINVIGLIAGLNGYEYPMMAKAETIPLTRAFNWIIAFITIIAIVVIYERMNTQLKRERDAERDRYKDVARVALESSVVSESAESLALSGKELLDSTIQQKTAIEQLATTTEELGATAEQNAHLTISAKSAIKDTEAHLLISKADILQLVSSMNQMRTSSEEIQSINNVINDISYQTNILSLNAMIEASRSSEASGGFKVVALEVKRLAERSAKAADNINKLLDSNFASVQQGVTLSETMQVRFDEIEQYIKPLADAIQNVADASAEQNEAIRQIVGGLADIDRAVESNKELAAKTSNMANQMSSSSQSMVKALSSLQQG
jgi:hypothetical protein